MGRAQPARLTVVLLLKLTPGPSIDKHIVRNIDQLRRWPKQRATHHLWHTIAKCIERGIADATLLNEAEAKKADCHGKINIRAQTLKTDWQNPVPIQPTLPPP